MDQESGYIDYHGGSGDQPPPTRKSDFKGGRGQEYYKQKFAKEKN